MNTARGNQAFCGMQNRGESAAHRRRFFASSPSANLVGDKRRRTRFNYARRAVKCVLHGPMFIQHMKWKGVAVIVFMFLAFVTFSKAQELQDEEDLQLWSDLQVTIPLNKQIDFYGAITGRFGKDVSRLNDLRFAAGINWRVTKSLSIMPFYWNIHMRNALSQFRTEHRWNVRATYRFPIKQFGLIHRSTYEYRDRAVNSWRYRAGLAIEKELPKDWIKGAKFLVGDEIFYDSLLDRFSRNRFTIGINKTISKALSLDIYYMRQNDGVSRPGDLHVIGTTWRLKIDR